MKFTDPQVRPQLAVPLFEHIPHDLRDRPQWVLWRFVWNKHSKQWAKVPFDAQTLATAKSDDPSTWASFDVVQAVYVEGKGSFDGIGFVFSVDDPYFGADFDNCIKDGKIDPSVVEWIDRLGSYTEKSVSGTGLHVIGKGVVGDGIKTGDFELYDRGRYFTFSGNVGRRKQIEYRQEAVETFKKFLKPEIKTQNPPRAAPTPGGPTVHDVLDRMFSAENGASLRTLYEGGMNGHKSPSEAIASLCWKAAFWCNRDPTLLDAVVRGSRLCDSKWDSRRGKQTWGSREVEKAIANCTEFFDWNKPSNASPSNSVSSETKEETQGVPWPELNSIALHGIVGEFVRVIEPHTEADPVALQIQFLTIFGNIIGRSAYFAVEGVRHYLNIFVLIVGTTSKGRKGTSFAYPQRIFSRIDDTYTSTCHYSGLSSGEGAISIVRDPSEEKQPIKEKGRIVDYQTVITDHGAADKRALVVETEFASVIARMGRDGATLSAVIRQAWDTGNLRIITRNNPVKATDAHISMIAHITMDELCRNLDQTEKANGFANRFLHVCARRSKCLPLGGRVPDSSLNSLVLNTQKAVDFARGVGKMGFDQDATALWFDKYPNLSAGRRGMLGVVTSRSEAYVLRLSCIYALLDCSSVIQPVHLNAALALWQYCEDSAAYIFGDAIGDRIADEVLTALRECSDVGLTRTQIRDLFRRNVEADRIGPALKALAENGLAHSRKEPSEGRPVERWFAITIVKAKPYQATDSSLNPFLFSAAQKASLDDAQSNSFEHHREPTKEELRRAALDPQEWRRLEDEAERSAIQQ